LENKAQINENHKVQETLNWSEFNTVFMGVWLEPDKKCLVPEQLQRM
jgi:hypothetical protein